MPAPVPFFSIICVCRNPGLKISAALGSVWAQREASYELIVIDGASTDGTREWLELHQTRLATLITEPDRGVYDAMNKGLAAANGEWVFFLGADDRLVNDTVLRTAQLHLKTFRGGVAVGEVTYDDGRLYRLNARYSAIRRNFVHHQGAFYRRAELARAGPFDVRLQVMADYDLNLRLERAGIHFELLPLPIAACASGGLSDAGYWRGYGEEINVRHRHFPTWRCWLWDMGTALRFLRKKFIRTLQHHG